VAHLFVCVCVCICQTSSRYLAGLHSQQSYSFSSLVHFAITRLQLASLRSRSLLTPRFARPFVHSPLVTRRQQSCLLHAPSSLTHTRPSASLRSSSAGCSSSPSLMLSRSSLSSTAELSPHTLPPRYARSFACSSSLATLVRSSDKQQVALPTLTSFALRTGTLPPAALLGSRTQPGINPVTAPSSLRSSFAYSQACSCSSCSLASSLDYHTTIDI